VATNISEWKEEILTPARKYGPAPQIDARTKQSAYPHGGDQTTPFYFAMHQTEKTTPMDGILGGPRTDFKTYLKEHQEHHKRTPDLRVEQNPLKPIHAVGNTLGPKLGALLFQLTGYYKQRIWACWMRFLAVMTADGLCPLFVVVALPPRLDERGICAPAGPETWRWHRPLDSEKVHRPRRA